MSSDARHFPSPAPKFHRNRMAEPVETMLHLYKSPASAATPDERNALQRQIAATDTAIDRLVYELYNLTEKEIQIVENATKTRT